MSVTSRQTTPSNGAQIAAPHETPTAPPGLAALDAALFKDVQVAVEAGLGVVELSLAELMALKPGSVVKLDLKVSDLIPLRLNATTVALGEIVAVDDHFGVRIVQVAESR